jgi:hypothetical protein
MAIFIILLLAMPSFPEKIPFSWVGLTLWGLSLLLAAGAAALGGSGRGPGACSGTPPGVPGFAVVLPGDVAGDGELLGVVRLASEVVEGSGRWCGRC